MLAEIFAPWYIHWWFDGFDAQKAALCVHLTRILLPAQLFFFAGGVFGAVLLVRKQFNVQAVAPLIYNLGTIVGGLLLVTQLGVSSLAIGTVAGAFLGPFLLNCALRPARGHALPAHSRLARRGPARVGAALAAADGRRFAGDRRQLDHRPLCLGDRRRGLADDLRQAAFHRAHGDAGAGGGRGLDALLRQPVDARSATIEFATGVADSVSRVAALGLLAASAMVALAAPLVELLFMGGRFSAADARECAGYFAVFSVSLFLWSAQAIYARAFYAAGNTFVPMAAGTVVTLVSLPIYAALYHWHGAMGLAIASDIGIALQTADHRRAAAPAAHGLAGQPGLCRRWAAACWPPLASGAAVWLLFAGWAACWRIWRALPAPDPLDRSGRAAGRHGSVGS